VATYAADKLGAPEAGRKVMPWKSFPKCNMVLLGNYSSIRGMPTAK